MTQGGVQGRDDRVGRVLGAVVVVGVALWSGLLGVSVLHQNNTQSCDGPATNWARCFSTMRTLKTGYVVVALLIVAVLALAFVNERVRRHPVLWGLLAGFAALVTWIVVMLEMGGAYMS